jgi:GTP-binding protein HflX
LRGTLDLANSKGLKKSETRKLEKLLHERVPTDKILTLDLAETAAEFSQESGHPIALVLDRRGQVVNITVGTPSQVDTPELRQVRVGPGRLCGQRIIYTQLTTRRHNGNQPGSYVPSREDLQCLAKNRLDLLAKIEVNPEGPFSRSKGEQIKLADAVHVAYLLPNRGEDGKLWKVLPPGTARKIQDESFDQLLSSLETEFRRIAPKLQVRDGEERAVLVAVIPPESDAWQIEDDLDELAQLTRTAGGTICGRLMQSRLQPDPRQFLGSGKAQELALMVQEFGANLVVVDQELNTNQQHELQKIVGVKVIDRTQLILDIFAQRAQTKEGKLQVELAQLNYLYPRLVGKGTQLSRLGGGIGTRGPGETKLEVDRRRMRDKMSHLQRETGHIREYRDTQRRRRNFENLPVVALTGYTNSGKSTLLNSLTKSDKLVEDKLFATLDPATRRTVLPDNSPVLFTDTVGFIKRLPTSLFAAFSATLEEVAVADMLLHVVDASHPNVMQQITSVLDVLGELHALEKPTITVLNKVDKIRKEDLDWLSEQVSNPIPVSALYRTGLRDLLLSVEDMLQEVCPYRQKFTA